jgi:thioredoxin 2
MSHAVLDERGVRVGCPSCGRTNRLTYQALGAQTRCGACQTPLSPPTTPVEAGDARVFDAVVAASSLPIVVDFWAPWCGPCRAMAPELEKVARATAGRWLVVKVNTDAVPDLGARFRVQSIPTLAVFHGGQLVQRAAGARSAGDIQAWVSASIGGQP